VKKTILLAIAMIVIVFIGRVMPHPYNFTPVIAITLLSSHIFKNKYLSLSIPLLALWISDLFINNIVYAGYYSNFSFISNGMIWTYGSIILVGLIGNSIIKKVSSTKVALASISGSTIFYLISNFGVWFASPIYAKSLSGLFLCYSMALPFYGSSLAGDLTYSALFFGAYQLAISKSYNLNYSKSKI
tara:strand:+ start:7101 stop:7661 length:561 start_codon:yes stop_codon:yes gene_type:complete